MSRRLLSKLVFYWRLFRDGDRLALWADIRRRLWSEDVAYGMARDLTVPHTPPPARVEFDVQPLNADLAEIVFDTTGLANAERRELVNRRRFWEAGIGQAHVAVDHAGQPCYIQWTFPGSRAAEVDGFFGGGFPHLAADEMLLEGAWGLPAARGQRIMGEAMSRITEVGAEPATRRAITFVGVDNEPSIRGCRSAGYEIYLQRLDRWRFGRRQVQWNPVAAEQVASGA